VTVLIRGLRPGSTAFWGSTLATFLFPMGDNKVGKSLFGADVRRPVALMSGKRLQQTIPPAMVAIARIKALPRRTSVSPGTQKRRRNWARFLRIQETRCRQERGVKEEVLLV